MAKKRIETEIIIVGSGTAGATLAKELANPGRKVIVIEKGKREEKIGTMQDGLRFYEKHSFQKSKEGMIIYGTSMVGGTSVVASGNAVRCLQKEFLDFGIDLENQFREAEKELNAVPLPDKCISEGAKKIIEAAEALGLGPKRIPKFINPEKCIGCGNCVLGCRYGAKWSAINYIDEALKSGASLMTQTKAIKVLNVNGRAKGIEAVGPEGPVEIIGDIVIIAAGGIQTPILLQKSGITNAGKKMFCDPFMSTYGITKNLNQTKGVNAPGYVLKSGRFIMFPFIDPPVQFLLHTGWKSLTGKFPRQRAFGMMTKIADESIGKVDSSGSIQKTISVKDKEKLMEGIALVKEIFIKAGAGPKSIFTIKQIRGPHPGGTAAIGEIVDNNLETEIKNLFVCDNSVLPKAPGLPPILTLIALGKWLSQRLAVRRIN
ncbi:MAG: GMC family oxidoreductase [Candidatus Omnitrophota bacterium]|jgi:choline dehydrogenase-like flavoprotein